VLVVPATAALKKIFAENRAVGRVALEVGVEGGVTRRRRVAEDGPLRMRCPNSDGDGLEAMIVNTAGGIAGGDCHQLDIAVKEAARLVVTTAAAEKIYRSLGPNAEIEVRLSVAAGARLAWLPQETILFDRARLARRIDVDLSGDASLLMAEAVVFGRSAMGETVRHGSLTDRWRVRRDGGLVFAETLRLDGAIADKLAAAPVANGGIAIATVLAAPADEVAVERVRVLSFSGEAGISTWNGLAVARLCAKDGATLRGDLAAVLTALGGELPRLWLN
jgi:urease accessory protein